MSQELLSSTGLFAGLAPEILEEIEGRLPKTHLDAGDILCRQGEPADAMFIVAAGRLEVVVEEHDSERVVSFLGSGAVVGEMALLSGEPRSATVRAIRDTEVVRIPAVEFERLLHQHPLVALGLARTLTARLRQSTATTSRLTRAIRTIGILPAGTSTVPAEFVPNLRAALSLQGSVRVLDKQTVDQELGPGATRVGFEEDGHARLTAWLSAEEAKHQFVIYVAEAEVTPWSLFVIRQADLRISVAGVDANSALSPIEAALAVRAPRSSPRHELILVHPPETVLPRETTSWLRVRAVSGHHHIRAGSGSDYGRLARSIGGRSLGVALSGGGARGFAHIGVLKALRERGLSVDMIGGTSMGAVIAAQAALGWDTETMIARNRKHFVECAVLTDLTFPLISLMKGRSTVKLLKDMFADVNIEDLWLPYFCVSTNLSRAQIVVHDRGPVWLWVRASSSVPGIGPPIPFEGSLLVDGGVLNNLPVDILRKRCHGPIMAVDVSPAVELNTESATLAEMSGWAHLARLINPWARRASFPNLFEILMRTAALSSAYFQEQKQREADLYFHPPTDHVNPLRWDAIESVVDIGYRYACQRIDTWARPGASLP